MPLKSDELANGSMRSRVIDTSGSRWKATEDFFPPAGRLVEHVADASLKDLMEIQTCSWLRPCGAFDNQKFEDGSTVFSAG